jgi:hypothetical protein
VTDETLELGLADVPEPTPSKPRKRAPRKAKAATAAPAAPDAWILTNRFNLIEMLSSRLIAPAESYRQYYTDLLAETPHGVPVFAAPPGPALRDKVVTDGENNFAVLLQLREDTADVVTGGLPLTRVVAVHFPDDHTLRDHESRPLGNVLPPPPLKSSPELFGEAGSDQLPPAPPDPLPTRDWATIDRARGAVAGITAAARAQGITPDSVEKFLDAHSTVVDALTSELPPAGAAPDDPDEQLALAILAALSRSDPATDWSPRRLVKALLSEHAERPDVARNLDAVRQIVSGERDFTPFRGTDSGGLVSAKALLLVLLRPRLDSLLEWTREDTNADDASLLLSGALAGWLTGVTRLPAGLRDVSVDDATAEWACAGTGRPIPRQYLLPTVQAPAPAQGPDLSLLDGRELGVARHLGVAVVTQVVLDAGATLKAEDGRLLVTTTGPVVLSKSVDRAALVSALQELSAADAMELLTSTPKDDD